MTLMVTSYQQPHESPKYDPGNQIIYYAQAPAELRDVVNDINHTSATGDTDVLYVGDKLAMNESMVKYPPATGEWHARMPLPWYTEALDADVASGDRASSIGNDPPPVVITTSANKDEVAAALGDGYAKKKTVSLDDIGDRVVVVFTTTG